MLRSALLLAAFALVGAAPAPRATPARLTLASDSEGTWVPFTLTPGNQLRFAMTLDGRPVSAILDTGVSGTVLARRYAEANTLTLTAAGSASAIGGSVAVATVSTERLTLGGLVREGGTLSVVPLPAIATGSAQPVDLLVGRDLIGDYALDIDFVQHRFRLLPSGRMPFVGKAAPLSISPQRQVYVGEVALGGQRLRPMIIDTGDGSAVTVTAAGWRAARLPGVATTTALAFGLAGQLETRIGIVPTLGTGELTARNVEVRIEPAGGFSEQVGVAGRIGTGFLQRYRVLLDPRAGRMVLTPGPDADAMPARSTSGLLMGLARDRLRVLHVMAGGPAAVAGWRAGEEICAVDGVPIAADYATSPLARWTAGAAGRTVALTLCGGTTRQLTLRQFY